MHIGVSKSNYLPIRIIPIPAYKKNAISCLKKVLILMLVTPSVVSTSTYSRHTSSVRKTFFVSWKITMLNEAAAAFGHKLQLATTNRFQFLVSYILQLVVIYDIGMRGGNMHFRFSFCQAFVYTGNQQMYHEFREPASTAK